MKKYLVGIMVMSVVIALSAMPSASQEAKEVPAAPAPATPSQDITENKELSIYGEVQTTNVQANLMSIQYYDYDNDEERSIEIVLDKDVKLENVKTIDEIKKGDWVDVTYTSSNGKNIAKLVSVEKEEPMQEEGAPSPAEE